MTSEILVESLPLPLRLALSYCAGETRPRLAGLFALDTRLGQLVRQQREPMLAQLKLAWWRDILEKPVTDRPRGDEVLDSLAPWDGEEDALVQMVDAWELLVAEELGAEEVGQFAEGRAAPFGALAAGMDQSLGAPARIAARRWALADLAANIGNPQERSFVLEQASRIGGDPVRLPRGLRSLVVLDGLARRSLKRDGAALLDGAGGFGLAMRLGMFGR